MADSDAEGPPACGQLLGTGETPVEGSSDVSVQVDDGAHESLKYHLLGPSATKAGLALDQSKISEIIYEASKGSKFFQREQQKDKLLTEKIAKLRAKAAALPAPVLAKALRESNALLESLEASRDLSQAIVHVDCDAFFAAVEQLDRPDLCDVPFAVGTGVLTTANYHARTFGCRSGMAAFVARKLCPHLILLPNNHAKYGAKATEIRAVIAEYDARFESASIDEAYVNITGYCAEHGMSPDDAVAQMRAQIHARTQITVSAGIAANARIAKICSNMNKPNGQFRVPSSREVIMQFIGALATRKVNGIGRVLERELAGALDVHTCADLYDKREYLAPLFGDKTAGFLMRVYLGLGRTNVQPAEEYERKSVGTESTFSDMSDAGALRDKLRATAEALEKDLARHDVRGRTLVLKVKLHTFEVLTRQVVLGKAVNSADDLYKHALPMLAKLHTENPGMTLRLMGLRCTSLASARRPDAAAFFGIRGQSADEESAQRPKQMLSAEEEWEVWPEDELGPFEELSGSESPLMAAEADGRTLAQMAEECGKDELREAPPAVEERWQCPICGHSQQPDERLVNEHIDLCLSRQTIRDAVEESSLATQRPAETRRAKPPEKKRGRSSTRPDPKQKKLCFG